MPGAVMPGVDLQVPFGEKDSARGLGARWDPQRKLWYVPDRLDIAPFRKWLPEPFQPNVRAPDYKVATGRRCCWHCQQLTRVFAIVLPAQHEVLIIAEEPSNDCWQAGEGLALLSYIERLLEPVAVYMSRLAARYRVDYSHTTGTFYWMNHCEHCQARLGDFETLLEFEAPFHALGTNSNAFNLQEIAEPFAARCGSYTNTL